MPAMASRPTSRDWLLFGLISFFWGSSYLFIKIGIETLAPLTLIANRLFFGSLVLGGALLVSRQAIPRDRATYGKLVVMALVNIVIPFSLITWGERYIDSSLAAILQATTPLFTIVIASLALAEEAITLNRLVGLIVGFCGVVVLFSHGLSGGSTSSLPGEIALVLSSVSYACGAVFVRVNMRGFHPTVPAFFQVSIALLITTLLAVALESPVRLPDTPGPLRGGLARRVRLVAGLPHLLPAGPRPGRDPDVAHHVRDADRRDRPRRARAQRDDRPAHDRRDGDHPGRGRAREQPVGQPAAVRPGTRGAAREARRSTAAPPVEPAGPAAAPPTARDATPDDGLPRGSTRISPRGRAGMRPAR